MNPQDITMDDDTVDLAIIYMTSLSHAATEQKMIAAGGANLALQIKRNREVTAEVLLNTLVNLKRYRC